MTFVPQPNRTHLDVLGPRHALGAIPLIEQIINRRNVEGAGEEKSLSSVHLPTNEREPLFMAFYAFSYGLEPQGLTELNQGVNERRRFGGIRVYKAS